MYTNNAWKYIFVHIYTHLRFIYTHSRLLERNEIRIVPCLAH